MSVKLTKEKLNELKEAFKDFDKDDNGTISAEEFRSFMKKQDEDMSDIEIDIQLIIMDASALRDGSSGDGKVNFEEFLSMQTKSPSSIERNLNDDQLMRIFKLYDSSGDGYISKTEMQKISKAFGEESSLDEIEEVVEMMDADCDGKVSFDEFKALMKEGSCDSSSSNDDSPNIDEDFTSDDEEMFKRYDADGDGFVTHEELKAFAKKRRVSITDREVDEMIKDADINEDGKVTFEEYKAMMNKRDEDFTSDEEEMFKRYDKDGDGFITHEEIKAFAKRRRMSITDTEIEEMIKDADANEDGKVSFEEVKAMMNKRGEDSSSDDEGFDFEVYDRDGDGFITHEEMKEVMDNFSDLNLTNDEIDKAIKMADTDGDGKISFEEYKATLTKKGPSDLCSFTKSGRTYFHKDDYYECRTCNMMSNEGEGFSICSLCIKVCHTDHDVKYVGNAQHFCDCGAKGAEVCLALKPIAKKKDLKATLSEDEVAEIKETFKEMDVDGNGTITSEELQKVMKEHGEKLPEAVINVMVAMADTDGDGKINFEEFLQMATTGPPDDITEDQMFKIFDKNGDGFISCDEMQKLMVTFGEDLSDAEVNELIKEADTDGDGRVTLEEFKAAMN